MSGSLTLRTNINGMIRGIHVTRAQPIMSKIIADVVVIYQSPPQLLQQL